MHVEAFEPAGLPGQSPTCTHFLPLVATIKEQKRRGQLIRVSEQRLREQSVSIILISTKQLLTAVSECGLGGNRFADGDLSYDRSDNRRTVGAKQAKTGLSDPVEP